MSPSRPGTPTASDTRLKPPSKSPPSSSWPRSTHRHLSSPSVPTTTLHNSSFPVARAPAGLLFASQQKPHATRLRHLSQSNPTVDDYMSRWRVVSTKPLTGDSGDITLGATTTIEQSSPHLPHSLASQSVASLTGVPAIPPSFENGHVPAGSPPPGLKRKYASITRDTSPRDQGTSSTASDDYAILTLPAAPSANLDLSVGTQGGTTGRVPAIDDSLASLGAYEVHVSDSTDSRPLNMDTQAVRAACSAPSGVPSRNTCAETLGSPTVHPISTRSHASSPAHPRTRSTSFVQHGSRSSRSPRPTRNVGVNRLQSPAAGVSPNADCTGLFGNGARKTLQNADPNTMYDPPEFHHLIAGTNSDIYSEELFPVFSYLHEDIWLEGALSKEELSEQQESFNNRGQCMSSLLRANGDHHELSNVAPKNMAVPRCRKHPEENPKSGHSDDGCCSDCFDEYDPFDDVSELQATLGRLNMAGGESAKASKIEPPQTSTEKASPMLDTTPHVIRRPYLSYETRAHLGELNKSTNIAPLIGSRLHTSFSMSEAQRVWVTAYFVCLDFAEGEFSIEMGVCALLNFLASNRSPEDKYEVITSIAFDAAGKLPGRATDDITRYMNDVLKSDTSPLEGIQEISIERPQTSRAAPNWSSLVLARVLTGGRSTRGYPRSHAEIQSRGHRESLRFLQPFRTFTEGSSDIVDCAWDATGENFALACTTYNDMYNRPGNLMLGSLHGSIKFMCGHQTSRPDIQRNESILEPYIHSTVSSVEFSGGLLYSGSYDSTVKIWDVKDRKLRKSLGFSSPVVSMKMSSSFRNTGAACLRNGDVAIFRPWLGETDGGQLDTSQVFPATNDRFEGSSVLWTNSKARNGWVFVSYDNKEFDKRGLTAHLGDLRVFDTVRGCEIGGIKPGSTRQLDICLDESEQLLVAGAVSGPARALSPDTFSFVRVWDLRESFRRVLELGCKHKDINKVTISPCQSYLTSSGTNGKSYLWDIRHGSEPLHVLEHGDSRTPLNPDRDREEIDTGVTFASWTPADGSLFVTGSSDGSVKVWDPARADPFLYELAAFADPVMSGAFSPDGDSLVIGETTGRATVLSYAGRHGPPEDFVQDRSMLAPSASEAEESGIERAQRLLQTGQVVLVSEDGGRAAIYGR